MKKTYLCLFVMIICVLAGCHDNEENATDKNKQQKPELEAWIFFDENTPGTHYIDMWAELEEEFNCDITLKTFATEELKDKLRISLACNELPDIFAVWGGTFPDFIFDTGACLPVQDYITRSDNEYKDFYLSEYDDGNTYIIPCLVEAYAVTYCNSHLMELIGVEPPSNWEGLLQFVEKVNQYNTLNHTNYAPLGIGNKDNWLGELLYTMIVNRMEPYALDKLMSGEMRFSDEIFLDAAYKIVELVDAGAFADDFLQVGEVESIEYFIEEKAVLFPHQSTITFYLIDNMGEDAIELVQFPDLSEGLYTDYQSYLMNANFNKTPGLCISKNTEYKDEAAAICLEFSKKVNEINVTEYGYINYMEEYLIKPVNLPKPVVQFTSMVDEVKYLTSFWYGVLPHGEASSWRDLTKKLYAKAITPEEFIEQGEQYFEASSKE